MSIPENFNKLAGNWSGTNRLHTPWIEENPISESESDCSIETVALSKFLKIEYTLSYEEKPQAGMLIVGTENDSVKAVWIDSWHNGDKFMSNEGTFEENSIKVKGFYAVPDHPDWGWITEIAFENEDSFKIIMHNVTPVGEKSLAVEADYKRQQ
jgi:hypothetical protein